MSLVILCAMRSELKPICAALKNVQKVDGDLYQTTTASGQKLIIASSGLGSVHAACRLTEIACTNEVSGAFLLGVGGGLKEELDAGVLVVADRILQHDSLAVVDEGRFFMQPGSSVTSQHAAERHDPFFLPDSGLKALCLEGSKKCSVQVGTIVCGGEFSGTYERKIELAALAEDILLVEMEAGGFAVAANRLNIPFAVAKGVADRLKPPSIEDSILDDYHNSFASAMTGSIAIAQHIQETL